MSHQLAITTISQVDLSLLHFDLPMSVRLVFQKCSFFFLDWKISSSCPLSLAESTNCSTCSTVPQIQNHPGRDSYMHCSMHSAPFTPNTYFLFKVCIPTRISTHSLRQFTCIPTLPSAMALPFSRDSSGRPSLYLSNLALAQLPHPSSLNHLNCI